MIFLGDPSKPKSWSKYASDSFHNVNKTSNEKSKVKPIDLTENTEEAKNKSDKKKKKKKADKKENDELKKALEKVH